MNTTKTVRIQDDANAWSVGITRETIQRILASESKHTGDMIALWMFYAYTARWQETNRVFATNDYVSNGLKWPKRKTMKIKKELINMGLIEALIQKDGKGKITGWYVLVFHLAKAETVQSVVSAHCGQSNHKCFNEETSNALKKRKTPNGHPKLAHRVVDLDFSSITENQERMVKIYNKHLPPLNIGFLPITKLSPELCKVLDAFEDLDDDDFIGILNEAVSDLRSGGTNKTLVRILWSNY